MRKVASSVAAIALAGTSFFTTGTALAQPSTTEEVAGTAVRQGPDQPSLTRGEIIERAKVWLTASGGGPVPYSMEKIWSDGYRQDCSGYVSMTWGLDPGGYGGPNTVSLAASHAFNITKDELKTGDILIDRADGRVRLAQFHSVVRSLTARHGPLPRRAGRDVIAGPSFVRERTEIAAQPVGTERVPWRPLLLVGVVITGFFAPGRPDVAIARMNLFNYAGTIIGSTLIGAVYAAGQLRLAFAIPLVLCGLILLVAKAFAPRTEAVAVTPVTGEPV